MKELMATARNISLSEDGDRGLDASVELVLTVSEPSFKADAGGEVVKHRVAETIRFSTNVAGLRHLAKNCEEWADSAEALLARVKIDKATEPTDA